MVFPFLEATRGYPVTRYAEPVKKNLDAMQTFKTEANVVGFSLAEPGRQPCHGDCLIFIQDYISRRFTDSKTKFIVPKNAVTVSFAMPHFHIGKSCQEFVPANREIAKDAFFTYQKFSKHVQATYYNEKGVEYLAGVCYYPQIFRTVNCTCRHDGHALTSAIIRGEVYTPGVPQDRYKLMTYIQYKRYGRYCGKEKKRVTVEVVEQGAKHAVFNYLLEKWEHFKCDECAKDAEDYTSPVIKKPVVVKAPPAPVAPAPTPAPVEVKKPEKPEKRIEEDEYDFGDD